MKELSFMLLLLLLLACKGDDENRIGTNPGGGGTGIPGGGGTGTPPEELIKPCPTPDPKARWQIVGDSPISGGVANFTSIVFHKNVPYVLYSDDENLSRIVVKKYNGNSWENVGNASSVANHAENSSMAIDSSGNVYVSFAKIKNSIPRTSVIKYNGTSWRNVGDEFINDNVTTSTSIAIDKNNIPYLVYSDETRTGANDTFNTKVFKYQGSWVQVGGDLTGPGGDVVFITIDRSGRPFVIYKPTIGGSKKAVVKKYNGSSWASVGRNNGISRGQADYTSIVLNPLNNDIYAVFTDEGQGFRTVVKKYSGSSWASVGGNNGISTGAADYASIALNNDLKPYVIFNGRGRKAVVKKYNGSSWEDVVGSSSDEISTGQADYTDIAMSPNCVPYVVFSDHGESKRAVVMKYE